ncbi:MAG TPA: hypothetical protein VKM55_11200 [Candidatus Lokiarchaeia archaeon]|nr:hypothetical protein [Candidatus Lokiarchaeia archaeon]
MADRDYGKISTTAISVAFARATYTSMPFAKEIFEKARNLATVPFYAGFPGWLLHLGGHVPRLVDLVAGLEIRYMSTNAVLETLDESWAIVEIAAGISARSLELASRQRLYVETDLPGMLGTKQKIYEEIASQSSIEVNPNHYFKPLNALDPAGWDMLGKTHFAERASNIAVINEGLLSYLSRDEKARLRDNIAIFFKTYAAEGAWISPDFANLPGRYSTWMSRRGKKIMEHRVGRLFDRFDTRDEVVAFMQQGGFRVEFPSNESLLPRLSCIPMMHIKSARIPPILEKHQACIARLA